MTSAIAKLLFFELLMVTVSWCGQPIRLRDKLEIMQPKIMLADLLPPYASEGTRRAVPAVELGGSPQPGALRLLRREQIVDRMQSSSAILDTLSIPDRVLVSNPGVPITEDSVRSAVAGFFARKGWQGGLPKNFAVAFPRLSAAAGKSPQLEVTGANWDLRQDAIDLRLRCSNRSCGSFLVYLYLPDWLPQAVRSSLLRAIVSSPLPPQPAMNHQPPGLVTKGKPATLILQNSVTQISVPVVCLQAGSIHQTVRVFDRKTRQVFEAEVIGPNLLRGSL